MSVLAAALILATPPDPASLAWGAEYAVKGERATVDGMLERDRVWVSRWWDGRYWQSVEQVTWLSPRFLARWTGYEGARHAWTPDQSTAAWQDLERRYLQGSTFVVSLSAFPKMPIYEVGDRTKPDPTPLGDVRVVLVKGEHREVLTLRPLAVLRGRERRQVEDFDWWTAIHNELPPIRQGYFGDYWRVWYAAYGTTSIAPGESFEIQMFSDRRARTGSFTNRLPVSAPPVEADKG